MASTIVRNPESREALVIPERVEILAAVRASFVSLVRNSRLHDDIDRLPAHLRRDAGLDEREIERSQAARAALIR